MQRYARSLMVVIVMMVVAAPAMAKAPKVTDAQVVKAIDKAVEWLYSEQNADGHWDKEQGQGHRAKQWAGWTSLIMYGLMTAGEEVQANPKMQTALKFLMEAETYGTYAVGLRAHVWNRLPDRYNGFLEADLERLLSGMGPRGGYTYELTKPTYHDLSNTQYGVLGVWEAAKRGINVQNDAWKRVEDRMRRDQNPDGGWGYTPNSNSRGSMTSAGLALLYITQDYLHTNDFRTPGAYASHPVTTAINRGLEWFDKNFNGMKNAGHGGNSYYYAVGVERVGVASGVKFFNKQDWYQEIAAEMLKKQKKEGNFSKDVDTAFALIFLARGRSPVTINKLSIPNFDWNNRPRDIANFTSWLSAEIERELLFQVVDINTPGEEWLDAPIVYLASHRSLSLTEQQEQHIKDYIDLGGMLITVDEGNGSFSSSVKGLMEKLYPQYTMEPVDNDDYVFNVVYKDLGRRNRVESVHNGVRHLNLHITRGDPSWVLHSRSMRDRHVFEMFANMFHYATEKGNIRPKLETHIETRKAGGGGQTVTVGRVRYQGQANAGQDGKYANWNPEPGAWKAQSNWMFNHAGADPTTKVVDLASIADPEVDASTWSDAKFMHMTGTDSVQWTEQEIAGLRRYVESGGVVLIEAAGGSLPFADSVTQLLSKAFPGQPVRPLSTQSDVLKGNFAGGKDNSRVLYRMYAQQRVGRLRTPRIQAMTINGAPRVLISHEDISLGVLNQPVWGIYGYHSESARSILANMTMWSQTLGGISPNAVAPSGDGDGEAEPDVDAEARREAAETPTDA